jgi:hypothetical protein
VDLGRDGRVPQPAGRLTDPPFLAEVERACEAVPGARVEHRAGYLAVTLTLPDQLPGLSERAAALLSAFPAADGTRTVRVDVRNRHWAGLVVELAEALQRR